MIGTIVFCRLTQKGPCGMTVNNDIDDDSATKHGDSWSGTQRCSGEGAEQGDYIGERQRQRQGREGSVSEVLPDENTELSTLTQRPLKR